MAATISDPTRLFVVNAVQKQLQDLGWGEVKHVEIPMDPAHPSDPSRTILHAQQDGEPSRRWIIPCGMSDPWTADSIDALFTGISAYAAEPVIEVTLGITHMDGTVAYYKLSPGIPPPTLTPENTKM